MENFNLDQYTKKMLECRHGLLFKIVTKEVVMMWPKFIGRGRYDVA